MLGYYGGFGGMRIGRGDKPTPVPLCPLQIPHYLTWARTRAAVMGSRRQPAELWRGRA
jgi:hypothetical protein